METADIIVRLADEVAPDVGRWQGKIIDQAIAEIKELRAWKAAVIDKVQEIADVPPDLTQHDYDLWVELAEMVLGHA